MSRFRLALIAITVVLALVRGLEGLALGVAAIAVNELAGLRLSVGELHAPPLPGWLRRLAGRLRRRRPEPFPGFETVVGEVLWASQSRRDFDFGLRRRLAPLAVLRLAQRRGVDSRSRPDTARELLGPTAFELLDPDRPVSSDRESGGVSLATLERVVARLEEL